MFDYAQQFINQEQARMQAYQQMYMNGEGMYLSGAGTSNPYMTSMYGGSGSSGGSLDGNSSADTYNLNFTTPAANYTFEAPPTPTYNFPSVQPPAQPTQPAQNQQTQTPTKPTDGGTTGTSGTSNGNPAPPPTNYGGGVNTGYSGNYGAGGVGSTQTGAGGTFGGYGGFGMNGGIK